MASILPRPPRHPRRGKLREWSFLGAALVSSAALLVAADLGVGDPEAAGQAELARVASELEQSIEHEWQRMRSAPWDWMGSGSVFLAADLDEPLLPEQTFKQNEEANALFEALMDEARRLGRQGATLERRLSLIEQAISVGVDSTRLGRARVAAMGMALAEGQVERALNYWKLADAELRGDEGDPEDGISLWLKAGLAVEPELDPAGREALLDRILRAWDGGSLALPLAFTFDASEQDPLGALGNLAPLRAALRRRVESLGETPPDWYRARLERDRRRALETALGQPLAGVVPGAAWCARLGAWEIVLLPKVGGWTLRSAPAGSLASHLEVLARGQGLLPVGFDFSLNSARLRSQKTLRTPLGLVAGPLVLGLYHSDRDSYVSRVESKRGLLRLGLLLMALFTAVAGFLGFRAMARARRLASLKSSFVANVSHELRTPIASILLMAENLELGRVHDAAGQKRYMGLIQREAHRLRRLVDDVLDFSRLERGDGIKLNPREQDYDDFVGELESELSEHMQRAGGELRFEAEEGQGRLYVDSEALRRAMLNLLDNALRHSGIQHAEVHVAIQDGALRLVVRDRGTGVPRERLQRMLEPFERLESRDAAAGTGLGLSIVREIARAHGGELQLKLPADGPGLQAEVRVPAVPIRKEQRAAPPARFEAEDKP